MCDLQYTAHLRTKIMDFRGFDSNIILILRGGISRHMGNFPECSGQAILLGRILVGRLGVWSCASCRRPLRAFPNSIVVSREQVAESLLSVCTIFEQRIIIRERAGAPKRGRHSTIHVFPPDPSVQWQPDGLTIHTNKWFLEAAFLGAPPISLMVS